jgi:hypothetical protein
MAALIPTRCVTPRILLTQSAPFRRRLAGRANGFVTAEGPMAVGWRCSNGLGRCVRKRVLGAEIGLGLFKRFGRFPFVLAAFLGRAIDAIRDSKML